MSDQGRDDTSRRGGGPAGPGWAAVDRAVDRYLDLDEGERSRWLDELRRSDPALSAILEGIDDGREPPDAGAFASLLESVGDGPAERDPSMEELQRIGPYEIVGLLGRGGMGSVYRARRVDGGFEQEVALKVLRSDLSTPAALDRFLRERQMLADLRHPHIAGLLDGGVGADGRPWFAMELVEGRPLLEACDEERMGPAQRVRLFDQVLAAVAHAHRNLVVHRDLKPANILVGSGGGVRLLDFGIAKLLDRVGDETLTAEQALTPAWASPEQLAGEAVTTASDIYSLGLVLHVLLSGVRAFEGATESGSRPLRDLEAEPLPMTAALDQAGAATVAASAACRRLGPRGLRRALAGDLDAVVARALRSDPAARYPSVDALREDLRRHRDGEPVEARRGTAAYRLGRAWRRHRPEFLAVGAVILALGVGLGVSLHQTRAARAAEQKMEAVNRFLTREILASADPEVGGPSVTLGEVLDASESMVGRAFAQQPEIEATVRRTLGAVRLSLGDAEEARAQLARAETLFEEAGSSAGELRDLFLLRARVELAESRWEAVEAALGQARGLLGNRASGLDRAAVSVVEGRLDHERGDSVAAERRLRGAVEELEAERGAEADALRAEASLWLARALGSQTLRNEASEILRDVVAYEEQLHGPDHPRTAEALSELAGTLSFIGRPEAIDLTRRAHDILRRTFGEEHPRTMDALNGYAVVTARLGDMEAARQLLEPRADVALELAEKGYGQAMNYLNLLAVTRHRTGDPEGAEEAYRRALATADTHLGPSHDRTMMIRRNLSNSLARRGRIEEAVVLGREVERLALEELGKPDVDPMYLANSAWFLARALAEPARDLDAARRLAERAVELSEGRRYYPLVTLSEVRRRLGDLDGAIEAQLRGVVQPDALYSPGEEAYMVELFEEAGDLPAAETFLRAHLQRRIQGRPAGDPLIGHSHGLLGRNLLAQDRAAEARGHLERATEIYAERSPPPGSSWEAEAWSDLGEVLLAEGRAAQALAALDRAATAFEAVDGGDADEEALLEDRRRRVGLAMADQPGAVD